MLHTNFIRLKEGCPLAFAEIHAQYGRRIFWVGRRMISDDFVIESLVQDTFLKLWVHRDRIASPEHIFFFLRFVMQRECISHYTRPKNRFFKSVHSLERFGNYQDYMAGYEPLHDLENRDAQARTQEDFDKVNTVLPLLNAESRHLIALCLTYGFQYKAISEALGTSIAQTSTKVKKAIGELRTIIHQGGMLDPKDRGAKETEVPGVVTPDQAAVLKLRCEAKHSFAAIAAALNRSQKEVQRDFMAAYKILQQQHSA